jgi:hypothetical protein
MDLGIIWELCSAKSKKGITDSLHSNLPDASYTFFAMALPAHSGTWPLIQFHNHVSQTVELLG